MLINPASPIKAVVALLVTKCPNAPSIWACNGRVDEGLGGFSEGTRNMARTIHVHRPETLSPKPSKPRA